MPRNCGQSMPGLGCAAPDMSDAVCVSSSEARSTEPGLTRIFIPRSLLDGPERSFEIFELTVEIGPAGLFGRDLAGERGLLDRQPLDLGIRRRHLVLHGLHLHGDLPPDLLGGRLSLWLWHLRLARHHAFEIG